MTKAEQKLDEVNSKIQKLKDETEKRVKNLQGIIADLRADVQNAQQNEDEASQKIGSLKNEIKLLEEQIAAEKKDIEELNTKISNLNPEIESKDEKKTELQTKVGELESKKKDLDTQIQDNETKKANLTKEKAEKSEAFADLEASIDKDLEKNTEELEKYKQEYQDVLDKNLVWEYVLEKIDASDIEILAIIAANREISLDEIKSKAQSVTPVFVSRAISKLEADDKIINKDGMYDLSPRFLQEIES